MSLEITEEAQSGISQVIQSQKNRKLFGRDTEP